LGLSQLTATILRAEGLILSWVPSARVALLLFGFLWSALLAWKILRAADIGFARRSLAEAATILAMAPVVAVLTNQFLFW